jgi:hypothetical protein
MADQELQNALEEGKHHRYAGYAIPWYVHVIWLSFWILCIYYVLAYLFPAMRAEIVNPP